MNEWKEVTLGSISINNKGTYGIPASAVPYSKNLLTYLRITDINDDGTISSNERVSVDNVKAKNYLLSENDIVFARTGNSTGRSYFYEKRDGKLVYAGFLIKFSLDEKKVLPKFMRYYTLSKEYKNWIKSYNTGSTRGNINAQQYANMRINLPSRKQQQLTADTLSCLDDKIELNNKMNKNLEEMAQAIFKSWFVDFEPFKDGEFVDSELGKIPKGWKVGTIGKYMNITTKSFNPKKNTTMILEHYSIPSFDTKKYPIFEISQNIKSNKFIVDEECFMISKLNPKTKRVWRPYCITDHAVCSTEFIVYKSKNIMHKDFYYSLIDSQKFLDFVVAHVTGSTGSRQRTIPKITLNYIFVKPLDENIKKFISKITPIYDLIKKNNIENQKLAHIRDTLLPQLMSGTVRVPVEVQ